MHIKSVSNKTVNNNTFSAKLLINLPLVTQFFGMLGYNMDDFIKILSFILTLIKV